MVPLVVGVDNATGLSVLQCLDSPVYCADYQRVAQGLYRDSVTPHLVDEETLGRDVAAVVAETGADLVVPSRPRDLPRLAASRDVIHDAGAELALPRRGVVEQLRDREWLVSEFPDRTPETLPPESESLPFAVVLRRRYDAIEGTPTPVEDPTVLAYERAALERTGHEPLVQRYVQGDTSNEFIVGQVYDDGRRVAEGAVRVLSKRWRYWGKVVAAESVADEAVLAAAREVGEQLDVAGCPVRLLFKRGPADDLWLLDVDPLFWEPGTLTAEAGMNGPTLLQDALAGGDVEQASYDTGVRSVRNNVYRSVPEGDIMGGVRR